MSRYVALLRGAHVGGRNDVPTAGPREAMTEAGADRRRSLMPMIAGTPEHQQMEIRSWATPVQLQALLAAPVRVPEVP